MNDQLNYKLDSIEHNQRIQRQKIDYLMQNQFRISKQYRIKDKEQTIKLKKNNSCITISHFSSQNGTNRNKIEIKPYGDSKKRRNDSNKIKIENEEK